MLVAIFAPLLAPHAPDVQDKTAFLLPPVWQRAARPEYLLGTDPVGRDILSRLLYGARFSLLIGAVVVTLSLFGGITLGLLAGYFRGWVDALIMRLMDLILAFPSLLLALVLVTILGPGLFNAMLAIALTLQPHFARLMRAAVMAEKNREYVVAAKVAGAGHLRLMLVTILPNCLAPLIVQATLSFSNAILERGRTRLPRPRRAAADARMGHHARYGARVHPARLVGGDLSGPRHPDHGAWPSTSSATACATRSTRSSGDPDGAARDQEPRRRVPDRVRSVPRRQRRVAAGRRARGAGDRRRIRLRQVGVDAGRHGPFAMDRQGHRRPHGLSPAATSCR